jgi:putative spermidine/putrescine transport system ATP-binding protein
VRDMPDTATQPVVHLDRLRRAYGSVVAVNDVTLSIGRGELVCLVGPSGCGKTTTLKMIAGFVQPTGGRISIDGKDVTGLPPQKRDTGMVFQNYALFPHLSVAENIAFGPRNVGMSRADITARVAELLDLVQMPSLADRYPHELSGGQQQRVALARALALRPAVLLLDEPLSNLDAKLRLQMREEIRSVVTNTHVTTVFVTHDQEEALAIADRIVVMNNGGIEQVGSAIDVYETPATRFVAQFIGTCNILPARRVGDAEIAVDGVRLPLRPTGSWSDGVVAIRPESLRIVEPGVAATLDATVVRIVFLGPTAQVRMQADGFELIATVPATQARALSPGDRVGVAIDADRVRWL